MKFLTITKSKPIKLSVDTALKAGTPISITGKVANDDTAIGLVANDTAAGTESIAIVTEGMVDVNEIAASYGEALTDDCIAALHGITFLHGGKAIVPAGGGGGSGLPDYSEASDGDVLSIEDGMPAWKEPSGGGGTIWYISPGEYENLQDLNGDPVPSATLIANVAAGKDVRIKGGLITYFATSASDGIVLVSATSTLTFDEDYGYTLTVGKGHIDATSTNALSVLSTRSVTIPVS